MNESRNELLAVLKKLMADPEVSAAFITQEDGMTIVSDMPRAQANFAKTVIPIVMVSMNNFMQTVLGHGAASHLIAQSNKGKMISIWTPEKNYFFCTDHPQSR